MGKAKPKSRTKGIANRDEIRSLVSACAISAPRPTTQADRDATAMPEDQRKAFDAAMLEIQKTSESVRVRMANARGTFIRFATGHFPKLLNYFDRQRLDAGERIVEDARRCFGLIHPVEIGLMDALVEGFNCVRTPEGTTLPLKRPTVVAGPDELWDLTHDALRIVREIRFSVRDRDGRVPAELVDRARSVHEQLAMRPESRIPVSTSKPSSIGTHATAGELQAAGMRVSTRSLANAGAKGEIPYRMRNRKDREYEIEAVKNLWPNDPWKP